MDVLDRAFASVYDRIMAPSEEHGLADQRRALLADLTGDVLEIGAGTGLNLAHYPGDLRSLVLTEPSGPMADRLRQRVAGTRADAQVRVAPAELLPTADGTVDHVVSTLVLCTVGDVGRCLGEVRRVLRPGGTLRLLEHVAAPGAVGVVQRVLDRPWRVIGRGCHLVRDLEGELRAAGFDLHDVAITTMPAPPPVRRILYGSARPTDRVAR